MVHLHVVDRVARINRPGVVSEKAFEESGPKFGWNLLNGALKGMLEFARRGNADHEHTADLPVSNPLYTSEMVESGPIHCDGMVPGIALEFCQPPFYANINIVIHVHTYTLQQHEQQQHQASPCRALNCELVAGYILAVLARDAGVNNGAACPALNQLMPTPTRAKQCKPV